MGRTAVAISGGGHRACLFALGALLYLAEAAKSKDVTSIASVSGGSLANGAIAQTLDFRTASAGEVRDLVGHVSSRVARGTLFSMPLTWIYLAVTLLVAGSVLIGPWLLPLTTAARILVFLGGLLVPAAVLQLRGPVCGRAFAATLFSPDGQPTRLREIARDLDHVICATDLHAGEHVYFSGRFVCGYRFGMGVPDDLHLHSAVRASAAFPGAFPPARFRTRRHKFRDPGEEKASKTPFFALVDGGVYDNMADQWAQGLPRRSKRWAALKPGFHPADELVVVNGSAGLNWSSQWHLAWPLASEVFSLTRDVSVLYDNGNSLRRQSLTARFDRAELEGQGLRGALVHIPQSPFKAPDAFKDADAIWPERAKRARGALAHLEQSGHDPDSWSTVAEANAAVKTTLSGLGTDVSARLLHHAYVLAMVNLHVILGYPLLDVPDRQRFVSLLEDGARSGDGS
jgi:predicted acylesterase/phospholipase RssA